MEEKRKPQKKFVNGNFGAQGWVLIVYGMLSILVGTLAQDSYSNLGTGILAQTYGWNQNTLIGMGTYFQWICIIVMMFVGRWMEKFSPSKIATIFGIILSLDIMLFGHVNSIPMYCAVLLISKILSTIWPQQVTYSIVANWFPKKKGLVMGWVTIAFPLGSGLGTLLFFQLMPKLGFTGVYYLYGAIGLATAIFGAFWLKDYPEEKGLFPDNDKNMTREEANKILEAGKEESTHSPWTTSRLLKTKEVWLIGLSNGTMMLNTGGFMSCMVPRLLSLGYQQGEAVHMMTIAALLGAVGSVVCGYIDAAFGPRKAVIITLGIAIGACILNVIPSRVTVMLSLALIGMVLGGASNYLVSIIATYWGRYNFQHAYKVLLPINQLIGASGSLLVTSIATARNFNVAYIVVACIDLVAIILMSLVKDDAIAKKTAQFEAEDKAAGIVR